MTREPEKSRPRKGHSGADLESAEEGARREGMQKAMGRNPVGLKWAGGEMGRMKSEGEEGTGAASSPHRTSQLLATLPSFF